VLREEGQPPLTPTGKDPCLRLFPGDDFVWILPIFFKPPVEFKIDSAVGCYVAAAQNIPVASPALFWVASMVYHWFPGLNSIRTPEMPMLVSAATVGGWLGGLQARKWQTWSGRRQSSSATEPRFTTGAAIAFNMTPNRLL
jgi:hypothetical protein